MSAARGHCLGFRPGSCVRGTFRPSGSKSLALRALLAAALARGETTLTGLSDADDVTAALALLADLGVPCERLSAGSVRVHGQPPLDGAGLAARGALGVGESGTLARLSTALLALASRAGEVWTIGARGSLLFRRSLPLFETLRAAGVEVRRQNLPGTWPVELVSAVPPAALELDRPVSSQEVSGLCLALAAHPETRELRVRGRIPSQPYLRMTAGVLALFGAEVEQQSSGADAYVFRVRGPLVPPVDALSIEPDASSAAVALAAACLSGGELRVPGLGRDSLQGDVRIVEHLAAFGCDARFEDGGLSARGFPERGAELDLEGEPDLAPVLCALAAGAALRHGATSTLRGLGTLPGKESDRLSVLAAGLRACGLRAEVGADQLHIGVHEAPGSDAIDLDPRGDHRMVFAFALLGLLRTGIRVLDPGSVEKSWSSFWRDMQVLGAELVPA